MATNFDLPLPQGTGDACPPRRRRRGAVRFATALLCTAASFLLPLTSTAQLCESAPTDPISWWPAEGDAVDAAGPNHGTLEDGTTFRAGVVGQAFDFDGVDDFIEVPDSASLHVQELTIAGWIALEGTPTESQFPMRKLLSDDGAWGSFSWNRHKDDRIAFTVQNKTVDRRQFPAWVTPTPIPQDGFHHVAFTWKASSFDGSDGRLFVDGVEVTPEFRPHLNGYTPGFSIQYSNLPLLMGTKLNAPNFDTEFFDGQLDEVRIFDRVLSSAEILALFEAEGEVACADSDGDGVPDGQDICSGGDDSVDTDLDTVPDFCDACPVDFYNDSDGDGSCDSIDLCLGDDATGDGDADGLCDDSDPCVGASNGDVDGDGICDEGDVCHGDDASGNSDGDAICDDLDACEGDDATGDTDLDLFCDDIDVCPLDAENDADGDAVCESDDNCPLVANDNQSDLDADGVGDVCDADPDGDGVTDPSDNCPLDANADQTDTDGDGMGDVCDDDIDGDGVLDAIDACVPTPTGDVVGADGCSIEEIVPCDHPATGGKWKNHGAYVRRVAHTAESFVTLGLITEADKDVLVSTAGESSCGTKK